MGYLIAFFPPVLDSIVIYLDKILLSKYNINPTIITLYGGFVAVFTGVIVMAFTGLVPVDTKTGVILVASGFLGVFYAFSYYKALTYDEGSRVGSLFQFIPVIILIFSFFVLGEKLQTKQYIGAILVVFSGFSLSVKKNDLGAFKINKSFWFMVISCLFSAFVYVLFKLGVKEIGFWGALPYEGLGGGLATLCILFFGKNFKLLVKTKKVFKKKILTYMTVVELLARFSRYILFFVLTLIPASMASVIMSTQPFFLIILGVVLSVLFPHLIKEEIDRKTIGKKILATIGIFIGLSLIFL